MIRTRSGFTYGGGTSVTRALLGALALGCIVSAPGRAEAGTEPVVVRVYQNVGLRAAMMNQALAEAGVAFAEASVPVRWLHCSREADPDQSHACQAPLQVGDRVIRIVNGPEMPPRRRTSLGEAFVQPGKREGVLATIFYDRIAWFAARARIGAGALLGRVIAHELGHLLLASTAHAERGLMRASWDENRIAEVRPANWRFSPAEVRAMQQRIAGTRTP